MTLPALILLAGTSEAGKSTAGHHLAGRGARRVKIRTLLLPLRSGRLVDHEGIPTREGFDTAEFLLRLRDLAAESKEPVLVIESYIDAQMADATRMAWPSPCIVVFVTADHGLRVRRYASANGLDQAQSAAVVDGKDRRKNVVEQWDAWRRLTDFWIENEGPLAEFENALDSVIEATTWMERHR